MTKAIIDVKDEVNCKIRNLELRTRQRLVSKFKYELPYARHTPAFKLGRWDGKKAFFQLSGATYINLLPEIIPLLEKEGYDLELNDTRDYPVTFEFDSIDSNTLSNFTWGEGHRFEHQPIILNDHQVDIVNTFLKNPQGVVTAATGAGKSIVTAVLSMKAEQYGRSIIIVPTKTLVTQTEEDFINLDLDVGVYFGDRKDLWKTHTICTWQSLNNLLKATRDGSAQVTINEFLDGVKCVIVDECHQAKADVLETLLSGPFAKVPMRWGLTGTIPKEKFEFTTLFSCIGEELGKISAVELQEKGILANCHIYIKQLQDDMVLGNYQTELKWLLNDPDRMDHLAGMIQELEGNTLVLVDRIAATESLALRLPHDRVSVVTGTTKNEKRMEEFKDISVATDKILISTYGLASTGLNLPKLFNLVLIEPGKSFIRVIQSIGRSLRVADGKEYARIFDITSNCKFSKRHLTKRKQYYREAEYPFEIEKIKWR